MLWAGTVYVHGVERTHNHAETSSVYKEAFLSVIIFLPLENLKLDYFVNKLGQTRCREMFYAWRNYCIRSACLLPMAVILW